MKTVITFGTYDLLHIGHILLLKRSKELGDRLVVGISSDKFNKLKKNKDSVYNENDRMEIVKSIKYVDEVFLEESFEEKRNYIKKYNADIMTMGSDWDGKFDELNDICEVVILKRTENISTTETIEKITHTLP
jgi:glycerol-3-phosphate cytidylyltransferase